MQDFINYIVNNNFFIITSDNYASITSKFFGYAILDNGINIGHLNQQKLLDKRTPGIFVNILANDTSIIIQQDYFCGFGLFIFREKNYWALSNSLLFLIQNIAKDKNISVNLDYFDHFFVQDLVPLSITETIISQITELPHGQYCYIDKKSNELHLKKYNYDNYSLDINSESGIELIDEWYRKYKFIIDSLITNNFNISIDLSGGKDSRIVFSIVKNLNLNKANVKINSIKGKYHTYEHDYIVASKIAEKFSFRLNNSISCEKINISTKDSILLSLYAKFFFHEQLYFKNAYYKVPKFSITGAGGEGIRNYFFGTSHSFIQEFENMETFNEIDFNKGAKNFLHRVFNLLSEFYNDPVDDAQKLYIYSRIKNHFGRSAVESFLSNDITIAPLMDPILYKLKITKDALGDRDLFAVLLLDRYLKELNELYFSGSKPFSKELFNKAKSINNKYPYNNLPKIEINECKKNQKSNFNIIYKEVLDINFIDNDIPETPEEYYLKLFLTPQVELLVNNTFNYKVYNFALNFAKSNKHFYLKYIIKLISFYILNRILCKNPPLPDIVNQYISPEIFKLVNRGLSTIRLDFKLYGSNSAKFNIINKNDPLLLVKFPKWFKNEYGQGVQCETHENEFYIFIQANEHGIANFAIRSVDIRDRFNQTVPFLLDILQITISSISKNFVIVNKNILQSISCYRPYTAEYNTERNEIIEIFIKWQTHDYTKIEFFKLINKLFLLI